MKKLILILLCLPFLANAQILNKIEVRELAGYSIASDNLNDILNSDQRIKGFSNQISVGYHFTKHFSIHASYEYSNWHTNSNAIGISPEYRFRSFYAGIDVKLNKFSRYNYDFYYEGHDIYKWSVCYGAHIGLRQKLVKGLYLTEEMGYGRLNTSGTAYYYDASSIYPGSQYYETRAFKGHIQYGYLRAGLSLRL